jgi:hypothetical protein
MPVESGNRAIKDGALGAVMQRAASVDLAPAMNSDDLQKGLSQLG